MSIPPGASYQASNTYVKLKRHLLNLETPVRIQFKEDWKPGNSLHDWYQRRNSHAIGAMELRRERSAPFFHQYIVLKFLDNHFFRIDRRQHPDETTPLDCIYEQGVEACDTIEEVTSFEDASYSPSDCLVGIEFRVYIPLERVLKILWAIHQHSSARVYTLQRYNCYFVAHTIISLATKSDRHFYPDQTISCIHNELSQMLSTYRIPYNLNPPNSKNRLPRALFHLFQRFRGCDQGFHNMCLTHFQYCLPCTRERTPSSSPSMTFNAAGRISNKPDLPVGVSDVILSRVHISLTEFWRHALAAALKVYVQVANTERVGTTSKQPMPQHDHATRIEWTRCVREALQQCANDLDPIVQRTLDCPTWDPFLTPEMDAEKITHLRRMDNWVEVAVAFFESEYDQLVEAFKTEVYKTINLALCLVCLQRFRFELVGLQIQHWILIFTPRCILEMIAVKEYQVIHEGNNQSIR
ncbi:unnamed protein product [Rhizoctonia solani]|uniref:Uncharacterized protein n=1 Tax=Rhizoctonia solani TaxID=456999 RepID=A0A8H2XBS2_9AGAM|nr:unnamed protein product [Rhizoctonia solani]CAE6530341.1 unnamed protein product [Rhizoctonia solani]